METNFSQLQQKQIKFSIPWALNLGVYDSKFLQFSKKLFIFLTDIVLISLKSELKFSHDLNMQLISSTFDVSKFSKFTEVKLMQPSNISFKFLSEEVFR